MTLRGSNKSLSISLPPLRLNKSSTYPPATRDSYFNVSYIPYVCQVHPCPRTWAPTGIWSVQNVAGLLCSGSGTLIHQPPAIQAEINYFVLALWHFPQQLLENQFFTFPWSFFHVRKCVHDGLLKFTNANKTSKTFPISYTLLHSNFDQGFQKAKGAAITDLNNMANIQAIWTKWLTYRLFTIASQKMQGQNQSLLTSHQR